MSCHCFVTITIFPDTTNTNKTFYKVKTDGMKGTEFKWEEMFSVTMDLILNINNILYYLPQPNPNHSIFPACKKKKTTHTMWLRNTEDTLMKWCLWCYFSIPTDSVPRDWPCTKLHYSAISKILLHLTVCFTRIAVVPMKRSLENN